MPLPPKFIPLAGRPTLVVRLPVPAAGGVCCSTPTLTSWGAPKPESWRFGPWTGTTSEGKVFGRGACDVKGPLAAAIRDEGSAKSPGPPQGQHSPGTDPRRRRLGRAGHAHQRRAGYTADGVVVLEPTEGLPRCASRGGLRFEIVCHGRAVHGTVKWLGVDAIALDAPRLASLPAGGPLERPDGPTTCSPPTPWMRPVTVDFIHGGDWQGMVCDRCVCGGYLELLPGDSLENWKERWIQDLFADLSDVELRPGQIEVRVVESYDGHHTPVTHPLCRMAEACLCREASFGDAKASPWQGWTAFNSGCEAGLRAKLLGSPTLVWGPGSLAQAHAVDEFVDLTEMVATAKRLARLAVSWANSNA